MKDDEGDSIVLTFTNNGNSFITMTESSQGVAINVNMTDAVANPWAMGENWFPTRRACPALECDQQPRVG